MAVYVDTAYIKATVENGKRYLTSQWCHMMADDVEELIAFAQKLGLKKEWLQYKPSGVHFDLTLSKRNLAVHLGAVEITVRSSEWFEVLAKAKAQYNG